MRITRRSCSNAASVSVSLGWGVRIGQPPRWCQHFEKQGYTLGGQLNDYFFISHGRNKEIPMLWYLKFNNTNIMRLRRINLKKNYVGRNALSAWDGRWDQKYPGEGQLDTGCREGVTALPGRREQDGSVQGEGPRGPSSCSPQSGQCMWIPSGLVGWRGDVAPPPPSAELATRAKWTKGQLASRLHKDYLNK